MCHFLWFFIFWWTWCLVLLFVLWYCCFELCLVFRNLLFTLPEGRTLPNGWREEAFAWVCGIKKGIHLFAGGNKPWCLGCAWGRASSLDLIEVPSEDTKAWVHQSKYKTHDRCQGTELSFKEMMCKNIVWQDKGNTVLKGCGGMFFGSRRCKWSWEQPDGEALQGWRGQCGRLGNSRKHPPSSVYSCSFCSCGLIYTFKNTWNSLWGFRKKQNVHKDS